ncbi:DUF975 family protein [Clostridium swellfunianum]|uniref:DUF975 family protein n=1 Tax=Clostridium swellfunianum TaxID=1367462 RepID=UPI00202F9612|nr:DUF975 family protein [Clostridium swellfunianum]MCM0648069.1 DUF975 family protein [Clostridium swellfunianum]
MWSRKELKDKAKAVLGEIYWSAFGISIVIALATGSGWSSRNNSRSRNSEQSLLHKIYNGDFVNWKLVTIVLFAAALLIAFRIFFGYFLEVGGRRFFIKSAQHVDNKKCFSFAFNEDNYMGILKTMLLTNIFVFLWSLLFIVPGIIKSYSYSMVPYILADNPNIGAREAISLSNKMTMGHKFDMFILDLSFLGWYILGAIALGIGVLFVMPYENATDAELYLVLRKNALEANLCAREDLLLDQSNLYENKNIW